MRLHHHHTWPHWLVTLNHDKTDALASRLQSNAVWCSHHATQQTSGLTQEQFQWAKRSSNVLLQLSSFLEVPRDHKSQLSQLAKTLELIQHQQQMTLQMNICMPYRARLCDQCYAAAHHMWEILIPNIGDSWVTKKKGQITCMSSKIRKVNATPGYPLKLSTTEKSTLLLLSNVLKKKKKLVQFKSG